MGLPGYPNAKNIQPDAAEVVRSLRSGDAGDPQNSLDDSVDRSSQQHPMAYRGWMADASYGIFRVLRSGAPWRDLPKSLEPPTTSYNRFLRLRRAGIRAGSRMAWRLLTMRPRAAVEAEEEPVVAA
jgi:hypothetical protein